MACNYAEPTSVVQQGALCYVRWANWGGGNDRVPLLIRSRCGRWIEKWEAMGRLCNFRLKTIPPEHPVYDRVRGEWTEKDLQQFRDACDLAHL